MNGLEQEPHGEFVPFDTYSFGISEAGPGGGERGSGPTSPSRRSPSIPLGAGLLPDAQAHDLAEALRVGASDAELGALLGVADSNPPPPRIQTLQLSELGPANADPAYHFDPVLSEDWSELPPDRPQPSVDVQKSGDRIEKISVRCGCGEVIHLDCVY